MLYLLKVIGKNTSNLHRNGNLFDDITFSLLRHGYGTTSSAHLDKATDEIYVRIDKKRFYGDADQLIKKIIEGHMMEDEVEITKITEVPNDVVWYKPK